MIKEELYNALVVALKSNEYNHSGYIKKYLDGFFDSNVCIPKGENRHKYADVLHEWIEGAEMQRFELDEWHNTISAKRFHATIVRIKPPEPVYEWQWVCQEHKDTEFFVPVGWHTFEELQPSLYSLSRLEETKRVRQ